MAVPVLGPEQPEQPEQPNQAVAVIRFLQIRGRAFYWLFYVIPAYVITQDMLYTTPTTDELGPLILRNWASVKATMSSGQFCESPEQQASMFVLRRIFPTSPSDKYPANINLPDDMQCVYSTTLSVNITEP